MDDPAERLSEIVNHVETVVHADHVETADTAGTVTQQEGMSDSLTSIDTQQVAVLETLRAIEGHMAVTADNLETTNEALEEERFWRRWLLRGAACAGVGVVLLLIVLITLALGNRGLGKKSAKLAETIADCTGANPAGPCSVRQRAQTADAIQRITFAQECSLRRDLAVTFRDVPGAHPPAPDPACPPANP